MLSLIPSNTTLCTESNYLFVVVLLVNWIMFQPFMEPNKGQYVQSSTGLYSGCLVGSLPMIHGLSNISVQVMHTQGIRLIPYLPLHNLGQVENDNVYSTFSLHAVLHVENKTRMLEIVLEQMIFLLICVAHICCPEHDIHAPSIHND